MIADMRTMRNITMTFTKAVVATSEDFCKTNSTILACPTYDHGLLHTPMDFLLNTMREQWLDLTGRRYILVGLWDPKYDNDYLVESVRLMREFVEEQGGTILWKPLKVIANPISNVENIKEWAESFVF
jgi:flavodoxin